MEQEITNNFEVRDIVEYIDRYGKHLTDWEVKFIADLIDNPNGYVSPKMKAVINRLYNEKC